MHKAISNRVTVYQICISAYPQWCFYLFLFIKQLDFYANRTLTERFPDLILVISQVRLQCEHTQHDPSAVHDARHLSVAIAGMTLSTTKITAVLVGLHEQQFQMSCLQFTATKVWQFCCVSNWNIQLQFHEAGMGLQLCLYIWNGVNRNKIFLSESQQKLTTFMAKFKTFSKTILNFQCALITYVFINGQKMKYRSSHHWLISQVNNRMSTVLSVEALRAVWLHCRSLSNGDHRVHACVCEKSK